ncbi:TIR domain-containing protein [Nostoc sp. NIES-2111]
MTTPEEILFTDAIKALRRELAKLPGKANPDEAFAAWLLPKDDLGFRLAEAAQFAAKRTGAQRSYRDVAVLGFAAAAEVLEPASWEVLKSGLRWVSGREPFIDGQPMDFCTDSVSLLGIALGVKLVDQDSVKNPVIEWMNKLISQSSHIRLEDWQSVLLASIEQMLLSRATLLIPNTISTVDVQISLQVKGLLPYSLPLREEGKTEVLSLIKREVGREIQPCRAALRIAAFNAIVYSTESHSPKVHRNNEFIVGAVEVFRSYDNSKDKISEENCASDLESMKDFFISYTGNDRTWAEWIAWVLEEAGYSVVIQAWDFSPGGNFVLDMQKATGANRTIAVLSSLYLQKPFPQSEWAAAFAQDPTSINRKLIPVRAEECNPSGLLGQIVYVDVFNCDEIEAQQRLLAAVKDGRMKPVQRPVFPGKVVERQIPQQVPFPGTSEVAVQNFQPTNTVEPVTNVLTPSQKRRLEERRAILEDERQIRKEKLRQLRKSEAIEAGTAIKFQLQQQIWDEEAELAKLDEKLDAIEQDLS